MADEYGYDEEDEQYQESGSNLVKDLRKQISAKTKAEKELREQLATLQKAHRDTTVRDALKSVGVSEKVARLVPADLEPTAEAVTAWYKEYADVFGAPQGAGAPESHEVEPDVAAQIDAMQQLSSGAQGSQGPTAVTQQSLASASSLEELMELIRKGGAASS